MGRTPDADLPPVPRRESAPCVRVYSPNSECPSYMIHVIHGKSSGKGTGPAAAAKPRPRGGRQRVAPPVRPERVPACRDESKAGGRGKVHAAAPRSPGGAIESRPLGNRSFVEQLSAAIGRDWVPKKPTRKPKRKKQLVCPPPIALLRGGKTSGRIRHLVVLSDVSRLREGCRSSRGRL